MFDLAITKAGDLLFEAVPARNKLILSFNHKHSSNPSLNLSFNHNQPYPKVVSITRNSFRTALNYNTKNKNKRAYVHYDANALSQYINNALRSTINDIKHDYSYGSKLELYTHENIHDKKIQDIIYKEVCNVINGILNDPTVLIEPVSRMRIDGYFQGYKITIFNHKDLITVFEF